MSRPLPAKQRWAAGSGEDLLVVAGVLGEAGIPWETAGGNTLVVEVDRLDVLDEEQRGEIAKLVVGSTFTPAPEETAVDPTVEEPPRAGAGSGRAAWAAYARSLGIEPPDDYGRDQIIELVEAQR